VRACFQSYTHGYAGNAQVVSWRWRFLLSGIFSIVSSGIRKFTDYPAWCFREYP
jgi:hypothetical protein